MSSRTVWIVGLIVALGATMAIRFRWPGGTGTTAADSGSVTIPEARPDPEPVAEASGESSQPTGSQNIRAEAPARADFARNAAEPATTPVARGLTSLESIGINTPPIPEFVQTEQAFASEAADPTWSSAAEARILDEISQTTGLQALDIQVDCRTTMCRIQMVQPRFSQGSFEEFVNSIGLEPLWAFNLKGRNGTPATLAYLKRNTTDSVDPRISR